MWVWKMPFWCLFSARWRLYRCRSHFPPQSQRIRWREGHRRRPAPNESRNRLLRVNNRVLHALSWMFRLIVYPSLSEARLSEKGVLEKTSVTTCLSCSHFYNSLLKFTWDLLFRMFRPNAFLQMTSQTFYFSVLNWIMIYELCGTGGFSLWVCEFIIGTRIPVQIVIKFNVILMISLNVIVFVVGLWIDNTNRQYTLKGRFLKNAI